MKFLCTLALFITAAAAPTLIATPSTPIAAVSGETRPVNFSAIPDVALYKREVRIQGFTLSLWGENEQDSFALGIANGLTGNSSGFALGFFNYSDNYVGGQVALVNWARKDTTGFQFAFGNYTAGTMHGAQFGAINYAGKLRGVQFGLINYAQSVESGVQIGFVNVLMQTQSWFTEFPKAVAPVMLLANWRFN